MWTIQTINVKDKRVLVRVDFNVPLKDGSILDDSRIRAAIPSIKILIEKGASKIVLMCHLGRPRGVVVPELSTKILALKLGELLGFDVGHAPDCVDVALPPEKVVVLENLRFHAEEKENDLEFSKKLALHGDVYVDDAFGVSHRAHASNNGVKNFLPSCIGLLFEREVEIMGAVLKNPKRPFVAVLGGSKISTKIRMIENLLSCVDWILLGGAMIFTFFKARGLEVGTSLVEDEFVELAKTLLLEKKIVLPLDVVVAPKIEEGGEKVVTVEEMPAGWIGLDIGPESIEGFSRVILHAETVFWNGPMGYQELSAFETGTKRVAEAIAQLDGTTIIGGGDSALEVYKLGLQDKFTHISTGGGASIAFFEGKKLPAIEALEKSYERFK